MVQQKPPRFGDTDSSDGEIAIDDVPRGQTKDVHVVNGLRYKEDAIGRWYQVDSDGRKVIRTRQQRRRVVGMGLEEWAKLSTSKKDALYNAALDAREARGLPREPTKEEQ